MNYVEPNFTMTSKINSDLFQNLEMRPKSILKSTAFNGFDNEPNYYNIDDNLGKKRVGAVGLNNERNEITDVNEDQLSDVDDETSEDSNYDYEQELNQVTLRRG